MTNTQTPEARNKDPDHVEVSDIWHSIQGEGPYAGIPAVLVRLSGCNLQCPACDTDYTSNRKTYRVVDLVNRVRTECLSLGYDLVVFTGGEPFRQAGFYTALQQLSYDASLLTQVETNGTIFDPVPSNVSIVVSPKTPAVNPGLFNHHTLAFKYVIELGYVDDEGYPTRVLGGDLIKVARPPHWLPRHNIYIQPMDNNQVDQNIREAVAVCLRHGFRLSLQLQKQIGLR